MNISKRGEVCWYEFVYDGRRIRKSTKQRNQNVARRMESAHRTALAKGQVGIIEREPAPTLAPAIKPATVGFYQQELPSNG